MIAKLCHKKKSGFENNLINKIYLWKKNKYLKVSTFFSKASYLFSLTSKYFLMIIISFLNTRINWPKMETNIQYLAQNILGNWKKKKTVLFKMKNWYQKFYFWERQTNQKEHDWNLCLIFRKIFSKGIVKEII